MDETLRLETIPAPSSERLARSVWKAPDDEPTLRDLPASDTMEVAAVVSAPARPASPSSPPNPAAGITTPWSSVSSHVRARRRSGSLPLPLPPPRLPQTPRPSDDADWITDNISDVKRYFRTLWAFCTRPRLAAQEWRKDPQRINPLGYILKSIAVIAAWRASWWLEFGLPERTIWRSIGTIFDPYLMVFVTGLVAHLGFRLLGSRRRLTSTWGASLLAIGGVPSLFILAEEPASVWGKASARIVQQALVTGHSFDPRHLFGFIGLWLVHFGSVALYVCFISAALAGLHGFSGRKALGIVTGALAVVFLTVLGPLFALGVLRIG